MIAIISTTIIMTTFYNLNQNLIVPMIIHFFFNLFIGIINGQLIELIMYTAIFFHSCDFTYNYKSKESFIWE